MNPDALDVVFELSSSGAATSGDLLIEQADEPIHDLRVTHRDVVFLARVAVHVEKLDEGRLH